LMLCKVLSAKGHAGPIVLFRFIFVAQHFLYFSTVEKTLGKPSVTRACNSAYFRFRILK
jgi:hypothetical protein